DADESLTKTAVRETREETGIDFGFMSPGELTPLGHVVYKRSRKRIYAFAVLAPGGAEAKAACWEIVRAEGRAMDEARERIHPDQLPFLERLVEYLEQKITGSE